MRIIRFNFRLSNLILLSIFFLFLLQITACKDDENIDNTGSVNLPSSLEYTGGEISLDSGITKGISISNIEGTKPMTFSLVSVPDAGDKILIDKNSGSISISNLTMPGNYNISVKVNNAAGTTDFENVLKINILRTGPRVSFEGHIKNIILDNCKRCHADQGPNINYTIYQTAKDSIDVLIERVNLNPGDPGFMPYSSPKLSHATISLLEQWKSDGMPEN